MFVYGVNQNVNEGLNSESEERKYKLSAVIEHFGSVNGGHYVGYRKLFHHDKESSGDKWVLADDD